MKFEVIPSNAYQRYDGATASVFGAVPWLTEAERPRWSIVCKGWTVRNPHTGQVGIGRKPWPTQAEAQAWADANTPSKIGIGD